MDRQLDLLVINPGNRTETYQSLGNELSAIEPPIWGGLLASYVRSKGLGVNIVDANALGLTPVQVANIVKDLGPILVCIVVYGHQPSASTQNMPAAGAIAKEIKQLSPTQMVMMLGGHVASLPERTLREENVDYVAMGEGLNTVVQFLLAAREHQKPLLNKVQGLGLLQDGVFVRNEPAPLLTDLDKALPMPPWDDLPMKTYRAHNWHCFGGLNRKPYAALYTTLGCPYKCHFCCIQAPFKDGEAASGMARTANSYRYWSPKVIGQVLEALVTDHGVTNVKFADEMFVLNRKHVDGICDEIISRGLKLNIWAYARVDTVKSGMLDKMKRAGFNWLAFGIESADESIRDGVDKGFTDVEMQRCLVDVSGAGINIGANYIFGLPNDDYDTMGRTLELATDVNAEYANFYSTMAYPGSPLYDQMVASGAKEGVTLPSSWAAYSQHSRNSFPLPTKFLTSQQIVKFRDRAFQEYFTSSSYLSMMKDKFGQPAIDEINLMLSHKLVRG